MTWPVRPLFRLAFAGPLGRLLAGVTLFILLLVASTVGYMIIEGWGLLDAVYMTVTTVTTVGYREVHPLSETGRVFTIIVVLFGVGLALYILTAIVQSLVEGELARALGMRRMKSRVDSISQHCILCGFGRVGQEIAEELAQRKIPFVIVDREPEAIERAQRLDYAIVDGDATEDAVLQDAGIERARMLMAASDSDAGNTYITLTAKALQPELFVVARVGQRAAETRLRRAGADRIISPYSLAGRRMALSAIQPMVVDFFDLLAGRGEGDRILAELVVAPDSAIAGETVSEALVRSHATTLLAIQDESGTVAVAPPSSRTLRPGDRLMLLSNEEDMALLGGTGDGVAAQGVG